MRLTCPGCKTPIDAENVNVSTDVAKCGSCGEVFMASALVADVDLGQTLEPPAGSEILFEMDSAGIGTFRVPRRGFAMGDLFPILFATFWVCFIAFWTWGASRTGLFALFSIPFWLVGIGMWRGILIGLTERQEIQVGREELTIAKRSAVSSSSRRIPCPEVASIEVETVMPRDPFSMSRHMRHFARVGTSMRGIPLPTISHGTKKTRFAEGVSEAEMKWLVTVLRAIVHRLSGARV